MYYNKVVMANKTIPARQIWVPQENTSRQRSLGMSVGFRNARRNIKRGVKIDNARISGNICYCKINGQSIHLRATYVNVISEKREKR